MRSPVCFFQKIADFFFRSPALCEENKIYFVEVFEKFKEINYQKLLDDGLHPNSEGHQKIFEIVKDFLIENKII